MHTVSSAQLFGVKCDWEVLFESVLHGEMWLFSPSNMLMDTVHKRALHFPYMRLVVTHPPPSVDTAYTAEMGGMLQNVFVRAQGEVTLF